MELPDRIAAIIKVNQLTPAGFADLLGVQRSSVSHVLNGRNKPSLDFVQKIIEHFPRVDPVWLISGKQAIKPEIQPENQVKPSQPESPAGSPLSQPSILPTTGEKTSDKTIEKIVVFYTDRTFDVYEQ
jgi:transcriptional regulator with XRE-family HTH domain